MKLLEKIFIGVFILSILLKAFEINFSSTIFVVSLSILGLHYFPFGIFSLINRKEQPHLVIYTMYYGFSISLGLACILTNILSPIDYKTFNVNYVSFIVSIIFLVLSIFSAFIMFKKNMAKQSSDSKFFYYFIYRCLVLIILIVLAYLPSSNVS